MKKENKITCDDKNCPVHGSLSCRGKILTGTILSAKMHRTAIVGFERRVHLPKFERYEKRNTKIKVHNPECINAKEGDIVKIHECRPLSKTKHFVIIDKTGKERGFIEKMEAKEESKFKKTEKEEKNILKEKEAKSKEEEK